MKARHLLIGSLTVILVLSAAFATDWPGWRGLDHNGISRETGWFDAWQKSKPGILWKQSIGTGFASMAVAGPRVYATGFARNRDTLYCFDAVRGTEIWKYSYAAAKGAKYYEGGTHGTPTVDNGRVYTVSKWGLVFCLDAAKGNVIWQKDIAGAIGAKTPTWAFATSPLVRGDTIYLNIGTAGVALKKADGAIRWKSGSVHAGYATPVPYQDASGRLCLAIFGKDKLYGVDAAKGQRLWSFDWQTKYDANVADPIVTGQTLFISSGYNKGCALVNIAGGRPKAVWRNTKMRNHFNSCVLVNEHLYGFDEKTFACLRLKDGSAAWTQRGLGTGSLMAAGDKLIILSERGELVIAQADPAGFKPLMRMRILSGKCWTVPVLANRRIYARNAAGDLVCVGAK